MAKKRAKKGNKYRGKAVVVRTIRPRKRRDEQRRLDYRKALIRQVVKKQVRDEKAKREKNLRRAIKKENKNLILLNKRSLTKCQKKKIFKKTMMKKLAAQVQKSGQSVKAWRNERQKNRKMVWEC